MPKNNPTKIKSVPTPVVSSGNVISADIFGGKQVNPAVLGEILINLQHNLHRATAHTKTRGEVQGTTRKPWRQKGTGRARVGTKRNPVWRGGGIAFGPRSNRNFSHKINQRLIVPAIITAIAKQAKASRVIHLADNYTAGSKTKLGLKFFANQLDPKSNLVVVDSIVPELKLAIKNIPYITLRTVAQINPLEVISHRRIILVGNALEALLKKFN